MDSFGFVFAKLSTVGGGTSTSFCVAGLIDGWKIFGGSAVGETFITGGAGGVGTGGGGTIFGSGALSGIAPNIFFSS